MHHFLKNARYSRIAYYIGYKIIKSYMQNNNVSLKELVVENEINDILKNQNINQENETNDKI